MLISTCSLFFKGLVGVCVQIDEIMKEAIQHDCTRYAPGIEIIGVRVTKPSIPKTIARNYEQMEEERTKVYIWTFYTKMHVFSQNFGLDVQCHAVIRCLSRRRCKRW